MLVIAPKSRQSNGFKNSTNNVSFLCLNSSFFITASLIYCIKESIGNSIVSEAIYNKVDLFWSLNQNLKSLSMELGYVFPFTTKLNLTFLRYYRFDFIPKQLCRQFYFSRRSLISEFVQAGPCMNCLTIRIIHHMLYFFMYLDAPT